MFGLLHGIVSLLLFVEFFGFLVVFGKLLVGILSFFIFNSFVDLFYIFFPDLFEISQIKKQKFRINSALFLCLCQMAIGFKMKPVYVAVGFFFCGLGGALNQLVKIANNYKMPAINKPDIVKLIARHTNHYCVLTEKTRFKFLSDVIYCPWPIVTAMSLGDLFILFSLYSLFFGALFDF